MIYYDLSAHPEIINAHYEELEKLILTRTEASPLIVAMKKFIKTNLKTILTGIPSEIFEINSKFIKIKQKKKNESLIVKSIFNYSEFSKKNEKRYCAYTLADNLNIRTCLYCNRQYTLTVINKDQITRPEFDHYFDQGTYPLLALSIYNLIPSCHICNSTLKHTRPFDLDNYVHPYVNKDVLKQYRYTYLPHDVTSILGGSSKLQVKIVSEGQPDSVKINNTKEVFKLEDVFNGHTEALTDLFDIRYKLSERYLEELMKTYKHLGINREEIYKLAFGVHYSEDDFVRRPFSKIKKDILKELGVI
jgi:hypothetical protein